MSKETLEARETLIWYNFVKNKIYVESDAAVNNWLLYVAPLLANSESFFVGVL